MTWTITKIREHLDRIGSSYLSDDAIKFYRMRIYPQIYQGPGGIFFVVNEVMRDYHGERRFLVREFRPNDSFLNSIKTHDQEFTRKIEAVTLAKSLAHG